MPQSIRIPQNLWPQLAVYFFHPLSMVSFPLLSYHTIPFLGNPKRTILHVTYGNICVFILFLSLPLQNSLSHLSLSLLLESSFQHTFFIQSFVLPLQVGRQKSPRSSRSQSRRPPPLPGWMPVPSVGAGALCFPECPAHDEQKLVYSLNSRQVLFPV